MKHIIFIITLLFMVGCSKSIPLNIVIDPLERAELTLPIIDKIKAREFKWIIITEDNITEVFTKLKADGVDPVLFGLTDDGYVNVSLNLSDIRTLILQQKAIINAYKFYYGEQNKEETSD